MKLFNPDLELGRTLRLRVVEAVFRSLKNCHKGIVEYTEALLVSGAAYPLHLAKVEGANK